MSIGDLLRVVTTFDGLIFTIDDGTIGDDDRGVAAVVFRDH
jgi:hypothetical protein